MIILIIEDDSSCRELIKLHLLKFREDFFVLEILEASTLTEGKRLYDINEPDMVLLDGALPDSPLEDTIKIIPTFSEKSAVIVLTNHESMDVVVQSMRYGAQDYLTKQVLTNGKDFIHTLLGAWKNFERHLIQTTGQMPSQRVKQVSEELLKIAEKQLSVPDLKSLIEFAQYAKSTLDRVEKRQEKIHEVVFEGNNGQSSIVVHLATIDERIEKLSNDLKDSLEVKRASVAARWGAITAIATGLGTAIVAIIEYFFGRK